MMTYKFEHVFGLGAHCTVRYQLLRHIFYRLQPGSSSHELWLYSRGKSERKRIPALIFDWQVTTSEGRIAYFENDFRGVFELNDLIICNSTTGEQDVDIGDEVRHRTLNNLHPHQFPHDRPRTRSLLREFYPEAREKFEYLAKRSRTVLNADGPVLFVLYDTVSDDGMRRLLRLLENARGGRPFHLAVVINDPIVSTHDMDPHVTIHRFPANSEIVDERWWQGVDSEWDRMLYLYDLDAADAEAQRSEIVSELGDV